MAIAIILPGIGGSGPDHWQTAWESKYPGLTRFRPSSWDFPDLDDWLEALDVAVAEAEVPPFLIAHSLACLLIAHWAHRSPRTIKGAFLVSVPDTESPAFPVEARSFDNVPARRFPFPTLVIASSNDPFATLDHSRSRARQWGAGYVVVGEHGHINGPSGLGDWRQGASHFEAFKTGAGG